MPLDHSKKKLHPEGMEGTSASAHLLRFELVTELPKAAILARTPKDASHPGVVSKIALNSSLRPPTSKAPRTAEPPITALHLSAQRFWDCGEHHRFRAPCDLLTLSRSQQRPLPPSLQPGERPHPAGCSRHLAENVGRSRPSLRLMPIPMPVPITNLRHSPLTSHPPPTPHSSPSSHSRLPSLSPPGGSSIPPCSASRRGPCPSGQTASPLWPRSSWRTSSP